MRLPVRAQPAFRAQSRQILIHVKMHRKGSRRTLSNWSNLVTRRKRAEGARMREGGSLYFLF